MGQLQETSTIAPLTCLSTSHALLLPYPVQGHINPLLQLGKRLASHGVRVSVAIVEHVHAKVVRAQQLAQLSSHPSGNDFFQIVAIHDGLPHEFERESRVPEIRNKFDKAVMEGTLELIHMLASKGCPVTCIVTDVFLRWADSLAEKAAVPEIIFWPQCASVFSMYFHVEGIISETGFDPYEGNRACAREAAAKPITCIAGLPMGMSVENLPFESPFGKFVLDWIRDVINHRFSSMGKAHSLIGNSFEALEPEVFKALTNEFQDRKPHLQFNDACWPRSNNIRLVGPLVPQAALGETNDEVFSGGSLWDEEVDECKQWLDSQPAASVLFVAFGSITSTPVAQFQELALGLAATGQKFLWVVRDKAITRTTLASSRGNVETVPLEEALPLGFLEQNQHLCKVVRWAPQTMVLSHPSVGGFFSHCGWNSTLESLCCGVPILGWPWLTDQVTNCWLVSHVWKVGITLERDQDNQTCKKHVESGVRQLMEGPLGNSLRSRAKELRDLARGAAQRGHGILSLVEDIRALPH